MNSHLLMIVVGNELIFVLIIDFLNPHFKGFRSHIVLFIFSGKKIFHLFGDGDASFFVMKIKFHKNIEIAKLLAKIISFDLENYLYKFIHRLLMFY